MKSHSKYFTWTKIPLLSSCMPPLKSKSDFEISIFHNNSLSDMTFVSRGLSTGLKKIIRNVKFEFDSTKQSDSFSCMDQPRMRLIKRISYEQKQARDCN